jgi:signal peptidase II
VRVQLAYGLAGLVFIVDQLTKAWIIQVVELRDKVTVPVLPFFSLTWVENRGVSMGLFQADGEVGRWLLTALTAGIAAFVAVWLRKAQGVTEQLALALVLGGAAGNIVDRLRFGYVVDFIHLHLGRWSFYVFNVADAAITVGVVLLLARAILSPEPERKEGIQ